MASEGTYYVPEQSKLPLFASLGLFLTVFGAANWLNGNDSGPTVFFCGGLLFAFVLWTWFSQVISENMAGMNSDQLKRSYVWGMGWFIFSEVMFFVAFFGALFYIRTFALPWLGGEGDRGSSNMLWQGFEATWPLMTTPDMAANGEAARVMGPAQSMSYSQVDSIFGWLPFWNTAILLTSSFTVHFAHSAIKKDNRKQFNIWLGISVLLGIIFLILQVLFFLAIHLPRLMNSRCLFPALTRFAGLGNVQFSSTEPNLKAPFTWNDPIRIALF